MESKKRYYLVSILLECDPGTHITDDVNVSFEDEPEVLGSTVTNVIPVVGVTKSQKRDLVKTAAKRMNALVPVGGENA